MKTKRTDMDVIRCALMVASGFNIMDVEELIGIPHSTVHWIIINRLKRLDDSLYRKCINTFYCHKHHIKLDVHE